MREFSEDQEKRMLEFLNDAFDNLYSEDDNCHTIEDELEMVIQGDVTCNCDSLFDLRVNEEIEDDILGWICNYIQSCEDTYTCIKKVKGLEAYYPVICDKKTNTSIKGYGISFTSRAVCLEFLTAQK